MTHTSLKSQSSRQVLGIGYLETGKKWTGLMNLQGRFQLCLRHLDKLLHQALSESI
ncbi:expressed protein, partial [Phakopsora pachyrhizi]